MEQKVGKYDARPEFDKLLSMIRNNEIRGLVVWKLDQLARDMSELRGVLRELRLREVYLFVVEDGFVTTDKAQVRALYSVMDMLYQFDKDDVNERILEGMLRAKAKGKRLGRPPISPDIIQRIRTLHEQGQSTTQIMQSVKASLKTVKKYSP